MHSADFVGCLDAVTEAIGWDTPLDRGSGRWRRGRGVAVGVKAVLTPTVANAVLQLNQDLSATLMISTVDMGQGSDTIMPQIVAEVLSMDAEQIRVVAVDTDVTPYDTITAGSRSTYHTGNAVRGVAERMRERLLDLAAKRAGGSRKDLKLTAGGVLNTATGEVIRLSEIIHEHFGARGATLTEEFNFTTSWQPYDKETGRSAKVTEHWFAAAAAVRLLVDRWTGRVRVEHLAVAGDVGRAINPTLVEQQLAGGAIMGLGHALFDELVFDQGQMLNGTLLDYQLPSVKDMPAMLTPIIVESSARHRAVRGEGRRRDRGHPDRAGRGERGAGCRRGPHHPPAALPGAGTAGDGRGRSREVRLIQLTVDGRRYEIPVNDDELLLDVLRDKIGAYSVREGCGVGACGACTVLVDGTSVSSCLARAVRYDGAEADHRGRVAGRRRGAERVRRVAGDAVRVLHPRVRAHGARAAGGEPAAGPRDTAAHLEGNICRCGTYREICRAVEVAAERRARA